MVLLFTPLLAGAVCAVMFRKLYFWYAYGKVLSDGDLTVGVSLGAVSAIALIAILLRSYQIYRGAQSRWVWAFRLAPFIAMVGVVTGLMGGAV